MQFPLCKAFDASTDEAFAKRTYGNLRTPRLAIVHHCFVLRDNIRKSVYRAFASRGFQLSAVTKQNLDITTRAKFHPATVPAPKRQTHRNR